VWFIDFPGASSEGQGALAMPAFFILLHRLILPLLMEGMDGMCPFSSLVKIPLGYIISPCVPLNWTGSISMLGDWLGLAY